MLKYEWEVTSNESKFLRLGMLSRASSLNPSSVRTETAVTAESIWTTDVSDRRATEDWASDEPSLSPCHPHVPQQHRDFAA